MPIPQILSEFLWYSDGSHLISFLLKFDFLVFFLQCHLFKTSFVVCPVSCSQALVHLLQGNSPNGLVTRVNSAMLAIYSFLTTLPVLNKLFTMCTTPSTNLGGLDVLFSRCFVSFMHVLVIGHFFSIECPSSVILQGHFC